MADIHAQRVRTRTAIRRILGTLVLVGAVALILVGAGQKYKVCLFQSEEDEAWADDEFDIPPPWERLTENQLVFDATFSGVTVRDGRLHSTYDRSVVSTGRRACPT